MKKFQLRRLNKKKFQWRADKNMEENAKSCYGWKLKKNYKIFVYEIQVNMVNTTSSNSNSNSGRTSWGAEENEQNRHYPTILLIFYSFQSPVQEAERPLQPIHSQSEKNRREEDEN